MILLEFIAKAIALYAMTWFFIYTLARFGKSVKVNLSVNVYHLNRKPEDEKKAAGWAEREIKRRKEKPPVKELQ